MHVHCCTVLCTAAHLIWPSRRLGPSWRPLELFGAFWGYWGRLGPLEAISWSPLGAVGRHWGPLGAIGGPWGTSAGHRGPSGEINMMSTVTCFSYQHNWLKEAPRKKISRHPRNLLYWCSVQNRYREKETGKRKVVDFSGNKEVTFSHSMLSGNLAQKYKKQI